MFSFTLLVHSKVQTSIKRSNFETWPYRSIASRSGPWSRHHISQGKHILLPKKPHPRERIFRCFRRPWDLQNPQGRSPCHPHQNQRKSLALLHFISETTGTRTCIRAEGMEPPEASLPHPAEKMNLPQVRAILALKDISLICLTCKSRKSYKATRETLIDMVCCLKGLMCNLYVSFKNGIP